jgi:hypothetical protein
MFSQYGALHSGKTKKKPKLRDTSRDETVLATRISKKKKSLHVSAYPPPLPPASETQNETKDRTNLTRPRPIQRRKCFVSTGKPPRGLYCILLVTPETSTGEGKTQNRVFCAVMFSCVLPGIILAYIFRMGGASFVDSVIEARRGRQLWWRRADDKSIFSLVWLL